MVIELIKKACLASLACLALLAMIGGAFLIKNKVSEAKLLSSASTLPFTQTGDQENIDASYKENEVLIKLKDKDQSVKKFLKQESTVRQEVKSETTEPIEGTAKIKESEKSNIYKVETTKDAKQVAQELEKDPLIEFAEPNYELITHVIPNDTNYNIQWGLKKTDVNLAWAYEKGSTDVTVAVVDTGVDWDHPDLAANIWSNSGEVANGVDTDSNGYIDDIRGWDFTSQTVCYAGDDCDGVRDNNPMDFQGHGTAVSGVASAATNNSTGVAGVGWKVKIMPVRAGYARAGDGRGVLLLSDAALAIRYAAKNGADVINMSWGGGYSATVASACEYAFNQGSLLVAAAGNSGAYGRSFPASLNRVLSVGATNSSDRKWSSSTYNYRVNIAAPGSSIRTTVFNNSYITTSGTSLASPLVAGAAALIKSYRPTASNQIITKLLLTFAETITDQGIGNRINARRSLGRSRKHPNGTVIMKAGTKTKYLIEAGYKRRIPSIKIFRNRFRDQDVVTISSAEYQTYPAAKVLGFKDGTLVRSKGKSTIYVIENNKRRAVTKAAFRKLNYKNRNVIDIKGSIFRNAHRASSKLTKNHRYPDGTLLKQRGVSGIYIIKDRKRWKVYSSIFQSWKLRTSDVVKVTKTKLRSFSYAGIWMHRPGSLIRKADGAPYYLDGNIKRLFKTSSRMNNFGYKKSNAYIVTSTQLKRYKYGLLPKI